MSPSVFVKSCITIFIGILVFTDVSAQKEYHIWYFGDSAVISFHTNPPTALHDSKMRSMESSSGICDANGNLLFYTNGDMVFNRNHRTMLNGASINYLCQSAVQGSMILPMPGKPNQYYILGSQSYEFYSVSGG